MRFLKLDLKASPCSRTFHWVEVFIEKADHLVTGQ